DRIGGHDGAKEVVVVFAIQEGSKVRRAVFAGYREGKTRRRRTVRRVSRKRRNAPARSAALDEPIHASIGVRRVDAGSIKLDGIVGTERARRVAQNEHRLLDAFRVEMERMSVGAWVEAGSEKIRSGDVIPALPANRDFDGHIAVEIRTMGRAG